MSLFVIGDLHLSLSTNKSMDVFPGWENYVERIRENWLKTVTTNDTVVLLGDISWAMRFNELIEDFKFIHNLPGNKIIIKGNHDYWWNTYSKMNKFVDDHGFSSIKFLHNNAYLVDGISICGTRGWVNDDSEPLDQKVLAREAGRLEASLKEGIKLGGELVAFLHYPPIFGSETNESILEVLKKYEVKRCFYGHIHHTATKKAINSLVNNIEYKLVSADFLKFCPIQVLPK